MSWLSRVKGLVGQRLDSDLDAELRSHIEMRIQANIDAGMTPEQARVDAVRRFGNTGQIKEDARSADILPWLETIAQDFRYALRMYRKSPLFTAVALLTLTLGIGANTAIFTLTHAVLLRGLPVSHPEELVRITFSKPTQDFGLSSPMFDQIKKRQQVYSDVFAWAGAKYKVEENGETRERLAAVASGNAFDVLGIQPAAGTFFTSSDDKDGGGPSGWVAVLGHEYWSSRFHSDPSVVGKVMIVAQTPVTIIGVLPRDFKSVNIGTDPAIILPVAFHLHNRPEWRSEGTLWLTVMCRLKPGKTLANAREEITRIGPGILHDADSKGILSHGFFGGSTWGVESGRTGRMYERTRYREPLLLLQILVGLILLICAANVAGLMLAKSSARRHEFAVRAALGATRLRMIRQLSIETGLIAVTGAASGLAVAKVSSTALLNTLVGPNGIKLDLNPDFSVLAFSTVLAVIATLVSAIPAALRNTRVETAEDLKSAHTTGRTTWAEATLVTTQVGLSVVLLVSAGLMAGTLRNLLTMNPGFDTTHVVLVPTDLSSISPTQFSRAGTTFNSEDSTSKKEPSRTALAYEQVLERLNGLPHIQSASAEMIPLLSGWVSSTSAAVTLSDGSRRSDDKLFYNEVGPAYFATAGTRVMAGRDVQPTDNDKGEKTCWLNQSAAGFFFEGRSAIGQPLIDPDSGKPRCTVAGIVEDTKYTNLRTDSPRMIYLPFMQSGEEPRLFLIIRTDNIASAVATAKRVLHDVVPSAQIDDAITVREQLKQSIAREQTTAMLAMFFGGLAPLLAGIGVYGLLAYQVNRRTQEIGVRIALGATRGNVIGLVVRQVGSLVGVGLLVGLVVAGAVAQLWKGILFDIKPRDPFTFAIAAAVLVVAAGAATFVPARRATRVDPLVALRYE